MAGLLGESERHVCAVELVAVTVTPPPPPDPMAADDRQPRTARRVAVTLMVLAGTVALIAWLLAGFDAPSLKRPKTTVAKPTAAVTACGDTVSSDPGDDPSPYASLVPSASVTFTNPTKSEVSGRAVIEFGGVGVGEARAAGISPGTKRTVEVRPLLDSLPNDYGCTILEARFSEG